MERSPADEAGSTEVAVAELPSTSGAHWANRDALRSGQPMWFRRPPAGTQEPEATAPMAPAANTQERRDDPGWNAFLPTAAATPGAPMTPSAPSALDEHVQYERAQYEQAQYQQSHPEHAQQLAETGASSRTSFGVTDEPISGHWSGEDPSPISPGPAPFATSRDNTGTGTMPLAVELPIRTADGMPAATSTDWPAATGNTEWPAANNNTDWAETQYFDREPETQPFFAEPPKQPPAPRQKGHHHQPGPRRRSKLLVGATVALSGMVMLGAAAAGVAYFTSDDRDLGSVLELGVGGKNGDVATAPIDGRTAASFELVAATRRAVVRTQDLGNDLYKITAAGDSGTAPKPTMTDNNVRLLLSADGDAGNGNVEVILSTKVTWSLKFTGGADEQVVDLSGGRVSAMELTGASRKVDLKLPEPKGTVPLKVTGAIQDLSLASPKGNPVRVQVDSGAQTVSAGTRTLNDVKPGSTLTPKDWKTANRYDVDAESRLTTLTVRTL